jgi:hypothetical protein
MIHCAYCWFGFKDEVIDYFVVGLLIISGLLELNLCISNLVGC